MPRRLLVRLVALGGSLLISLLLAEGLVRLVIGPPSREFQVYDKDLGWKNDPSSSGWRVTVDYKHWQQVNEHGLRGEYVPAYARDNGPSFRVLVLGDSFAEGAGVSDDEVFPAVLSKNLNSETGRYGYDVVNLGVSGYSTDQELLAFEHEGVKYSPDLTILAFVYNDLEGNVAPYASGANKPRFEFHAGSNPALTLIPNAPRPDESAFLRFKIQLRQHSRLYTLATDAIHKLQFTREFLGALNIVEPSDGEPATKPFGFFDAHPDQSADDAWALTEVLLGRVRDEVQCNGGQFAVVYIPPSFAVHDADWQQFVSQFGDGYERHIVRDRLQEAAARQGIDFLDLTPALTAAAQQTGDRVYFRHDTHWTPYGHAVVAQELETIVRRHKNSGQPGEKRAQASCSTSLTAKALERPE